MPGSLPTKIDEQHCSPALPSMRHLRIRSGAAGGAAGAALGEAGGRAADARRAPAAGRARSHDQLARRQGDADAAHRPGVSLAPSAAGRRPVDPHPRRAGRAAVLLAARPHAFEGLPVVRGVPARRGDAAGRGEDAPGDGQRHPAGRAGAAGRAFAGPPRRRRADERQSSGRGAPWRRRRPSAAGSLSRHAPAAGDRSHLGQDLDDLLANFGAGPRAHDRSALRSAGTALPRGGQGPLHASRRHRRAEVRLPRHGGVPRQGAHGRGVHANARPAGAGKGGGRHRAASLHSRFVRHAAADQRLGAPARCRRAEHRSRSASSRARTWRWSGSRRACAVGRRRRTRPSSKPTPTTCGCSPRECGRRISPPSGSASRRTTCSRWPTAWCWPPASRPSTACNSRCSKGWPTTSGGRCSS